MDPVQNPFSPGAGTPPPELAGRGELLEEVRVMLGRALRCRFSGDRVEDAAIDKLRIAQREALHAVVADLERLAKSKAKAIEKGLNAAMSTFVDQLIGDLKQENETLIANLRDKEAVLKRIRSYLPIIDAL